MANLTPDRIKILLVEDSEFAREVARSHLNQLGFTRIFAASDGMIAFERLKKLTVDLIITDWTMPRMDGLAFLRNVKKDPRLSGIPFIMLTAHGDKEKVIEAVKSGASDYIVKPVTPEILKEKIK